MGGQPLLIREHGDLIVVLLEGVLRVVAVLHLLHEVVDTERAVEACRTRGRQRVVRAGEVVTGRLCVVAAEEDGAGVLDERQVVKRLVYAHLHVLWSDAVRRVDTLTEVMGDDDLSVVVDGRPRDILTPELCELHLELLLHRFRERHGIRDEHRRRILIVLRLAQQIRRHEARIRLPIREHQHLRRTGDHIDPDLSEDLLLRLSDEGIARTHDLIDAWNRRRPIGERRHRLRAADLEDPANASDMRRREDIRIDRALLIRWGHHDDFLDPRDLRRNRIHQHRRRIRRCAARHIETDPLERNHPLPEDHARLIRHDEAVPHLLTVEGTDIGRRLLEHRDKLRLHLRERRFDLRRTDEEILDVDVIKLRAVRPQRRIPLRTHACDDALYDVLDAGGRLEARENLLVSDLSHLENLYHVIHPPIRSANASVSASSLRISFHPRIAPVDDHFHMRTATSAP